MHCVTQSRRPAVSKSAAPAPNRYKADLREINFLLFEQFKLGEVLGRAPYGDWGEDEVRTAIAECYRFATQVVGPLNAVGDEEGCRVEDGRVKTPRGFDEAWRKLAEAGWYVVSVDPELG